MSLQKGYKHIFLSAFNYSCNSEIIHSHNPPFTDKITTTLTWNLKYFSKRPVIHKSKETKQDFYLDQQNLFHIDQESNKCLWETRE